MITRRNQDAAFSSRHRILYGDSKRNGVRNGQLQPRTCEMRRGTLECRGNATNEGIYLLHCVMPITVESWLECRGRLLRVVGIYMCLSHSSIDLG
jgi:hypothetical protein